MIASPARYSILCAAVLGGLGWLALQGSGPGLLSALLLLPLVAWPSWLAMAYAAAVRKAQARALLREGAAPWWRPFLGGALLRQVLAVPLALLAAWTVGWWVLAEGLRGALWIAATAVLLYPLAGLLARQTGALRSYARLRPVLIAAPIVVAAVLTGAWGLIAGLEALGEGTLAEHVAAEPRYQGSSALLAWAVDGMAVLNGARAWSLGWSEGRVEWLATLWRVGATFGQFWLMASVFAGCLLPGGEARRVLSGSDADVAPRVGVGRASLAGFLLAIVSGTLVTGAAEGEDWANQRHTPSAWAEAPDIAGLHFGAEKPWLVSHSDLAPRRLAPGLPTPTALRKVVEAERVGVLACPPGTINAIEAIDRSLRDLLAARRDEVGRAAQAGFDATRARVPAFLDGYYSLTAEYVRMIHLVAGDAEAFLEEQFTSALAVETGFAEFRSAILALGAPLPAQTLAARDRLLADCGLLPPDHAVLRVTAVAPESLMQHGPDDEAIAFEARLAASGLSGVAGGLAGVVAGKVIVKLMVSETFGLAAQAVAKLAVAKAAGGLGGAAAGAGAGAMAGSVVPGLGTTVGAVLGGVVGGLALGVATDYALVRIEEAVSRDAFEAEILAAINAAEEELLSGLFPPS